MANELKMVFGSATTVISLAATLASGANTYSGLAGCTMNLMDNSTTLYPMAKAVLNINDTFAAAPTAGGTVDLFMYEEDVDGTTDETPVPAASDIDNLAKYVGPFVVDNQDVAHVKAIIFPIDGVQKARFAIKNSTGQQISYTSVATTVKVTPFSYVPT
jgi:hypothetical protein